MRDTIIQEIRKSKIIAIIRGVETDKAVKVAQALYDGGIRLVEVTFNQKDPASFQATADSISAICHALPENMLVGAGTVTTPALVDLARDAGAGYIISPDTDRAVIHRTLELGLVSIPGAYTPTEAKQAYNAGADFIKLFPCVGDAAAYLKAISAPLSHIPFLAVGGVSADNVADFLKAGAQGVGVGGSLVNRKWIDAGEYHLITEEAKRFMKNIEIAGGK